MLHGSIAQNAPEQKKERCAVFGEQVVNRQYVEKTLKAESLNCFHKLVKFKVATILSGLACTKNFLSTEK